MLTHNQIGEKGERLAQQYLALNGHTLLHCNWRAGHKEIDIITQKDNILHFVEVRSLQAPVPVAPFQTIDRLKQRHLLMAARAYMARYHVHLEAQWDVISVVFYNQSKEYQLEYLPNAFSPIWS